MNKDNHKRWVVNGIEHVEQDSSRYDMKNVKEVDYDYDDRLYILSYDPDISKLLLNRIVIKGFQVTNEDVEKVFADIFDKFKEANQYKTKFDHDYVTEAEVKVKGRQSHAIVNNIKNIPIPLRRAMFTPHSEGEMLRVQTVITKRLAIKNNLDVRAIDEYYEKLLDKNPKLKIPRTF